MQLGQPTSVVEVTQVFLEWHISTQENTYMEEVNQVVEKSIQLPAIYKLEDNQDKYKRLFFKYGMRTIVLIGQRNRTVTL